MLCSKRVTSMSAFYRHWAEYHGQLGDSIRDNYFRVAQPHVGELEEEIAGDVSVGDAGVIAQPPAHEGNSTPWSPRHACINVLMDMNTYDILHLIRYVVTTPSQPFHTQKRKAWILTQALAALRERPHNL
jgi:hypothetical protein